MTEARNAEDIVQSTLEEAWRLFSRDFVLWILAGLTLAVVSVVSLGLLSGPMTVGFIGLVEKRRQDQPGAVTDLFDGFSHFVVSLIASILIGGGVFVGSLLLVLPGLLFGLLMAFTFHAIALEDRDAIGAMRQSFTVSMENPALSTVFLVIVLILSGIGGAFVFGTLLTLPFSMILMTLAYRRLSERPAAD